MEYPQKRAVRFFNTTGPCNPWDHYMLPPEDRLVGAQLDRYIRDKLYWVLHAPRQTGKTTFLQSWMRTINSGSEAIACYTTMEACQGITTQPEAMKIMHNAICESARAANMPIPELPLDNPELLLYKTMQKWAELIAPKPFVVLIDEVDVLEGEALIGFLRQLRSGFAVRDVGKFPISIALVGMRDLKDYITQAKGGVPVNPGSPFNIKEDSATIGNFSLNNVEHLFAQRTEETGQKITEEALEYVWEQSRGQPWIVNSLFKRATMRILDEGSRETITREHIMEAEEQMILARETHLDSLAYRLENPAIRKIMETLIAGGTDLSLADNDAFRQCLDLGLVVLEKGTPSVANPIYREVIARQITYSPQLAIPEPQWQWEKEDGSLDMDALLKEFQKFWRKNSEVWEQKSDYTEAFPHLLLMAFLQRVLNGGGRIDREYAAGRGRMDLAVEYNRNIYIIEIKLVHNYDTPKEVLEEGIAQITKYRNSIDSTAPAYLVIFDRRPESKQKPWDERIFWNSEGGITIVGV
ncbi:MAG: PD-(D/E)XK nuclease domain-containing protein [Leptospirales bacterium]|nr:PD-(D/E)XK nuclease domain-containing protein [Leptospirales bacterium]